MSEFTCQVVRAQIEPHPNADAIEICRVGDYQSIVRKGVIKTGDLAIYIPEQAVLPDWMLRKMGFWDEVGQRDMLSGAKRNRVKAIKLRGILSQGLILDGAQFVLADGRPAIQITERLDALVNLVEGDDAMEILDIVKYEPKLPSHMAGRALGVDTEATHKYDFENIKKNPTMFEEGEPVVITEKIHGTLLQVAVVPSAKANERYYQGRVVMTSKGLGGKGIILDHNDETNIYAQAVKKWGLMDKMLKAFGEMADQENNPFFIFGEVFGKTLSGAGVQDLTYTDEELDYRAFDICAGNRGAEDFAPHEHFVELCELLEVPHVPVLYVGPYSKQIVLQHTDGPTTLHSVAARGHEKSAHIREGVVVKSAIEAEQADPRFRNQRKIAKSVSEAYLLRKGDATEFS